MEEKKEYFTEPEAVEFTGFSKFWFQQRRFKGLPPDFIRIGRSIRYKIQTLQDFMESQTVTSEKKSGEQQR